jgi:hypothetical protein
MNINISEKVIEDILTVDKSILAEILNVSSSDLSLLARQKKISSGILDMLYIHKDELMLIELKVVSFYSKIIEQIDEYYNDLVILQEQNKLIRSAITKIILVPDANNSQFKECNDRNIKLIVYSPKDILSKYYSNFKELSQFLKIQAGDYGVVRLGLLNHTLQLLGLGKNIEEIAVIEEKSNKTIRNRISVATLLGLVGKFRNNFYLTEIGESFIKTNSSVDDRLDENQRVILQTFVKENPFYSSITYAIFSIVETVFVLSKNIYPVPKENVKDYFVKSVGKVDTWSAERSKETATYIFANYATELDLLVKVDNEFFITPLGIQAVLLLQLNRSIKLIESKH